MSQIEAIDSGYLSNNQNYVIQMPTSAGKTLIAELAILNALVKYPNKKCIYVAPYRALANEKEQELSKTFSLLGYSVTSLNGSYELDDLQVVIMDEADVLLATPEKLDILFRVRPEFFDELSLVVIDEGHMIGDFSERSALLEFILIKLKMKFPYLNTLFISAVLSEHSISELSRWLSGKSDNVISSPIIDGVSWEPTRRFISKFYWENEIGKLEYINLPFNVNGKNTKNILYVHKIGSRKFPKMTNGGYNKSQTAAIISYNLSNSGSTLIFCSRPDWSYSVASSLFEYIEYLDSKNQSIISYFTLNEKSSSYKLALRWYGDDSIITKCLKRGIGIHNGIMFEPVKRAVEEDYRSGVLRVLVSTNTIGQGINFPIKNLIIHSLVMNHTKKDFKAISVRDFWNIIGRTGRAGLETEGQVIFLSNGDKDNEIFEKYIKKENLEDIKSYFTVLIEKLVSNRITQEYSGLLEIGSESHLINILAEELFEEKGLDEIINLVSDNSLFKFQRNSEDVKALATEFKNIASNINSRKTKNEIVAFSKTGLSLASNEIILEYIQENIDNLKVIVEKDDYLQLIKLIFSFLDDHYLREMNSNHTMKFKNLSFEKSFKFIEAWINGCKISDLKQHWVDADSKYRPGSNRMELFIQECLYFRYPWGISAFITLISYRLEMDWDNIPKNIKSLSMFLRYGVSSQNACMAMALGIRDRGLATKLSESFSSQTMRGFILALINSTKESLERKEFNSQEIGEIIQIGLKFNLKKYYNRGNNSTFVFEVRGIRFDESRKLTSKDIIKYQNLKYKREITNEYDPFAIAIYNNDKQVGYVPRDVAKIIATDIELNDTVYNIKVLNVIPFGKKSTAWNRIKVIMKKVK
nr:DEAD/DEAH box helicase [Bacillus sp. FJAT-29790]